MILGDKLVSSTLQQSLPPLPALTSPSDGRLPASRRWNQLFPPRVAFGPFFFYHNNRNPTKTVVFVINISTYEPQFTCAWDEVFKFALYQYLFLTDVLVIAVVAPLAVFQALCSELHQKICPHITVKSSKRLNNIIIKIFPQKATQSVRDWAEVSTDTFHTRIGTRLFPCVVLKEA